MTIEDDEFSTSGAINPAAGAEAVTPADTDLGPLTKSTTVILGLASESDAALPLVGVAPPKPISVVPPSINISIGLMI